MKAKKYKISESLLKELLQSIELDQKLKDKLIKIRGIVKEEKKVYTTPYKTPEELRKDLIKNQTPAEKLCKAYLKAAGIKYEFQKLVYIHYDKYYFLDFFLTDYKLAIEIDGGYHTDLEQVKKDEKRTRNLQTSFIVKEVLRLKNEEIDKNCITRIKLFIEDSKKVEKRTIEAQRKKYK